MPVDPITTGVGLGLSLIGGVGQMFGVGKANKQLDKLLLQDPQYMQSMYAKNQLGLAQTLFNGRMAGAGAQEQNIYNNQASTLGNIGRNAGDSSRALALAAGVQGQTNDAFSNLATTESQNKYGMLSNLNNAYAAMIAEGDKSFADQTRRFDNKVAVKGMQQQNSQAPWKSLSNLGGSIASFGTAGGFKDLFKK